MSERHNETLVSDADYIERSRLIIEFAYRLDHLQASTLYELCTEDAELRIGPEPVIGLDAIKAWGKEFDETDPLHDIRHLSTNFRFIDDGNGTAHGILLLTAFYTAKDQSPTTVHPFIFCFSSMFSHNETNHRAFPYIFTIHQIDTYSCSSFKTCVSSHCIHNFETLKSRTTLKKLFYRPL